MSAHRNQGGPHHGSQNYLRHWCGYRAKSHAGYYDSLYGGSRSTEHHGRGNISLPPLCYPLLLLWVYLGVVGVIFQAVGETASSLGPFTPPVVALLGFTNLSYGTMLLKVGIPVALITLVPTWLCYRKFNVIHKDKEKYPVQADITSFKPPPQSQRATITFAILFLLAMVYGIMIKAGTSYVIVVMLGVGFDYRPCRRR